MDSLDRSAVRLSESKRAWLSLLIVIHFFVLIVCLLHNRGASFLIRRLHQLTAPISILIHQDYGAKSLELHSDTSLPQRYSDSLGPVGPVLADLRTVASIRH